MSPASDASLESLKRAYVNYLDLKTDEIKEQKEARRYYHGSHWTAKQIKAFNDRKQPVVTYNRIGRKINAIVGLLERQKQDPRGFPRTPKHEEGAEVATAVLRYVCDEQRWPEKSPLCGLNGAVDGIGGIELTLTQGDRGDVEIGLDIVDPSSVFYDPRSLKEDFSDARFLGVGKWADLETAVEMFPDREDELRASMESGSELTSNPDHEDKWFSGSDNDRKIRIVDHWYLKGGRWHWCVYTGSVKLAEGESPFLDEKGKSYPKYVMFSAAVDHDGDRYGFVRNMKSANDEINQRRSKGLHILNSRRMVAQRGTTDIETLRREAARPDGVILYDPGTEPPTFDDNAKGQELTGQLNFLADAKAEIENYGFNPALIGTGVQDMSGRAIQLQQQAGIAELGPYLLAYKSWKLRVFRAIWNAVQRHWTAERWIRVTDDENVAQFFAVNQLQTDPRTGQPAIVNALGSLDVDIILDEGPDTINMQADAYDPLTVMARGGQAVPPELLIELSPLAGSIKKKALGIIQKAKQEAQQVPPAQQQAIMLELQQKQADTEETQSRTLLNMAKVKSEGTPNGAPEMPPELQVAETLAGIRETEAGTALKMAQARKTNVEASLKPQEMRMQERERHESRQERVAFKNADIAEGRRQPA